jgi:hypothetical protein
MMLIITDKRLLTLIIGLVAVLSAATNALAHGGPPRVEIYPAQAAPGAQVNIRGINISADAQVAVTLVGGSGEYQLGSAICDGAGDFDSMFTLPDDLDTGAYTVRAVEPGGSMLTAQLQVERPGLGDLLAKVKDIPMPLLLGALAVALGIVAVVMRQREARASA